MLTIGTDTVAALGFDLAAAIADYGAALARHDASEGTPAPAAHPLVERIVRMHGGAYRVVEPETGLAKADPGSLTSRLQSRDDRITALTATLVGKSLSSVAEIAAAAPPPPSATD
jgi:hypothetical protein